MKLEHELKFLFPVREIIIDKILSSGGKKTEDEHLLRRCIFYIPDEPRDRFIRVRDEGNCVTLTYKQRSATGVYEIEETVESFENTVELLKRMNMLYASYQENYRESYTLDEAQITFDTWPGIPPFLEVEARDEQHLEYTVRVLELDIQQGVVGTVDEVYQRFGINILGLPELTFQQLPGKEMEKTCE